MLIASMAFAYSGMAALCLSSRKYYRKAFAKMSHHLPAWMLKVLGFAALLMSLYLCIAMWGITVGVAAYWIVLALAAFISVLVNTYLQKFFINIALAALGVGLLVFTLNG